MDDQYIEFAGTSLDGDQDEDISDSMSLADSNLRMPDPNADKSRSRGKPLENLLLAKNRKMQEQLTTIRVRDRIFCIYATISEGDPKICKHSLKSKKR